MSGGTACNNPREHKDTQWRVVQRQSNHSAFSGYHRTPSEYSEILCFAHHPRPGEQEHSGPPSIARWRTKAKYVEELPDITTREITEWRAYPVKG